ncbi:hypothetical protein [Nonomuraea sp. CA-141351]|uniref:hypothetical protein n=1 Tax=Nonomuraea sp. CA-141351 TaxID=3239996 RepID=UPI003D912FF8
MSSTAQAAALDTEGGGRSRSGQGWRIVAALAIARTIDYGGRGRLVCAIAAFALLAYHRL